MKVLTLRQPWATLIAIREKLIETRSWKTDYRGPLLIHAGKSIDKEACEDYFIKETLHIHGFTQYNLPTGVILAKVNLIDCIKIDVGTDPKLRKAFLENGKVLRGNEYSFGDYTPGRYAWKLSNITNIKPIKAKGRLSLWNIDYREGE
ncbi:ASCH domain-containing protein [Clostridium sp.]|uniref:ASCH domain-containing protein n=1 Tax=Clostridium sp. TaxID=1506 RepID=UPI00263284BE|nr:ASCH domain-containing protein [Clostridium sp.]